MGDERVEHPWEQWVWDDSVFAGTARHYRRGRKPYAPGIAGILANRLGLCGEGRLLDVGCGPGSVALLFAPHVASVVGVDADREMVDEAARAARSAGVTNATWRHLRAEELPAGLGTFRVITFGQSFHWMDRPRVASTVRSMLEPTGVVVQVDLWHTTPPGATPVAGRYPAVPEDEIDALRRRWLGPHRRAGQGYRNTSPSGEDEIFQAAGFLPEEVITVEDARVLERTSDDVVAWVLSTSSTAPHLFGPRLAEFEAELRALLNRTSPDDLFTVALSDNRLRIRRPR